MRLILALIATTLGACTESSSDSDACNAMSEDFVLDPVLDERTAQDILTATGESDIRDVSCEDACIALYARDGEHDWDVESVASCSLGVDEDPMGDPDAVIGAVHCEGHAVEFYCVGGRRPLGHVEQTLADVGLGAYLAHCARLEAASVVAFAQLAGRLAQWHAPAELILRCHQAAREEAEHAAVLGELARAHGAAVAPATHHEVPVDLATAALDNAIEGCVHEAWSALACAATARDAVDPALRAAYARLAADEAGHAQLAWDLHTWFLGQVTPTQRASIRAAQRAALSRLPALARVQRERAPAPLALPDAPVAARFAAGLARAA